MTPTVTAGVPAAENQRVWILLTLGVAWLVLSVAAAVLLGRSVRIADERSPGTGVQRPLTTAALVP